MADTLRRLLVMTYAHIYASALQGGRHSAKVSLTIVIREQHAWFDDLGRTDKLLWSHSVWLIAWQECDVDVLDSRHLWYILSIACNVYAQTIDSQDIAIVAPLGVELLAARSGVIGSNRLDSDIA